MAGRIKIPVAELEFEPDGKAIWVHGPDGTTILRVQTRGKIHVGEWNGANPFCDVLTDRSIHFLLKAGKKT